MERFFRHVRLSLRVYQVIEALDEKALIRSVSCVNFLRFASVMLFCGRPITFLIG